MCTVRAQSWLNLYLHIMCAEINFKCRIKLLSRRLFIEEERSRYDALTVGKTQSRSLVHLKHISQRALQPDVGK